MRYYFKKNFQMCKYGSYVLVFNFLLVIKYLTVALVEKVQTLSNNRDSIFCLQNEIEFSNWKLFVMA